MKKQIVVLFVAAILMLLFSSPALALDPASLYSFKYYNGSNWVDADGIWFKASCDSGNTYCDQYWIDFSVCGDDPTSVGEEFQAVFSFGTTSGTLAGADMYIDSDLNPDVFDYYVHFGSAWSITSLDTYDIDWSYGQKVAYISIFYSNKWYKTEIFYRTVPCK